MIKKIKNFLADTLPGLVLRDPTANHEYLEQIPASKTLLPKLLEAVEINLPKNRYCEISSQMKFDEIPPEISQTLDIIYDF